MGRDGVWDGGRNEVEVGVCRSVFKGTACERVELRWMRLVWETGRDKGVLEEVREKRAWGIRYLLLSFLSSSVRTGGFSSMVETCVVELIAQLQCSKSHEDRCWSCGFVELWSCRIV